MVRVVLKVREKFLKITIKIFALERNGHTTIGINRL